MENQDPPEGCHHYTTLAEVPWDVQKYVSQSLIRDSSDQPFRYWEQRYSIFSKYDEGILMTDDAWFGVTPEPVAKYISLFNLCKDHY